MGIIPIQNFGKSKENKTERKTFIWAFFNRNRYKVGLFIYVP
jgi:hypothetical protein